MQVIVYIWLQIFDFEWAHYLTRECLKFQNSISNEELNKLTVYESLESPVVTGQNNKSNTGQRMKLVRKDTSIAVWAVNYKII